MSQSPSVTSTVKRVTAVLPKSAKTNISTFIHLCARNGTLDASTVLTLNDLLDNREFALEYKNMLADVLEFQKNTRATNKAIREEKKAAKLAKEKDQQPVEHPDSTNIDQAASTAGTTPANSPKEEVDQQQSKEVAKKSNIPVSSPIESPVLPSDTDEKVDKKDKKEKKKRGPKKKDQTSD